MSHEDPAESTVRKYVGALALMPPAMDEEDRYLVKRDDERGTFEFISAERLEGETYKQSLQREIGWALELDSRKDFLMSSAPRMHVHLQTQLPDDDEPIFLIVEFYLAHLYGKRSRAAVESNPKVGWVTIAELKAGKDNAGRILREDHRRLLCHADVLPPG